MGPTRRGAVSNGWSIAKASSSENRPPSIAERGAACESLAQSTWPLAGTIHFGISAFRHFASVSMLDLPRSFGPGVGDTSRDSPLCPTSCPELFPCCAPVVSCPGSPQPDVLPRQLLDFSGVLVSVGPARMLVWRPRQESNLHLRLRRSPFYPLNYGGEGRIFTRLGAWSGWRVASSRLSGTNFALDSTSRAEGGQTRAPLSTASVASAASSTSASVLPRCRALPALRAPEQRSGNADCWTPGRAG